MTDSSHLPRPSLVFPAKLPDLTQADYDRYKFKQARLDRHMTQEQFGAALGITASLVTKIERGERNVSDQVMHDLRILPEAASGAGEREELAAFGASEAAGYQYPGADQAAERAAFCAGAAHAASLPSATDPAKEQAAHIISRVSISHMVGKCGWKSYSQAEAGIREVLAALAAAPTIPATGEARATSLGASTHSRQPRG